MYLVVGNVLEVGVVLADEIVAERRGDQNSGGERGVVEDGEAVTFSKGLGIESLKKLGFVVLGVLPVHEGGREVGMKRGAKEFEEGRRASEYLRVNL